MKLEENTKMTDASLWRRDAGFVGTKLDESFVILNLDTSRYYAFNTSATDIWDLLEQPRNCGEITQALTAKYDVDPELCTQSVTRIMDEMRSNGLIHAVG